jgi:hydrogenase maturation protease
MKTLVVGLGNPILGDDGVGWKVAEEVERRLSSPLGEPRELGAAHEPGMRVEVDCVALGGLSLMERMVGYDRAIVIDSIGSGQHDLGEVFHFDLDDLYDPSAGHTTAVHDMSLMTALKLGRSMGAKLPQQITVVAVESPYTYDFTEELTSSVKAAVPVAAQTVMNLLSNVTKEREDGFS